MFVSDVPMEADKKKKKTLTKIVTLPIHKEMFPKLCPLENSTRKQCTNIKGSEKFCREEIHLMFFNPIFIKFMPELFSENVFCEMPSQSGPKIITGSHTCAGEVSMVTVSSGILPRQLSPNCEC